MKRCIASIVFACVLSVSGVRAQDASIETAAAAMSGTSGMTVQEYSTGSICVTELYRLNEDGQRLEWDAATPFIRLGVSLQTAEAAELATALYNDASAFAEQMSLTISEPSDSTRTIAGAERAGSVVALTDEAGEEQARIEYYAFGLDQRAAGAVVKLRPDVAADAAQAAGVLEDVTFKAVAEDDTIRTLLAGYPVHLPALSSISDFRRPNPRMLTAAVQVLGGTIQVQVGLAGAAEEAAAYIGRAIDDYAQSLTADVARNGASIIWQAPTHRPFGDGVIAGRAFRVLSAEGEELNVHFWPYADGPRVVSIAQSFTDPYMDEMAAHAERIFSNSAARPRFEPAATHHLSLRFEASMPSSMRATTDKRDPDQEVMIITPGAETTVENAMQRVVGRETVHRLDVLAPGAAFDVLKHQDALLDALYAAADGVMEGFDPDAARDIQRSEDVETGVTQSLVQVGGQRFAIRTERLASDEDAAIWGTSMSPAVLRDNASAMRSVIASNTSTRAAGAPIEAGAIRFAPDMRRWQARRWSDMRSEYLWFTGPELSVRVRSVEAPQDPDVVSTLLNVEEAMEQDWKVGSGAAKDTWPGRDGLTETTLAGKQAYMLEGPMYDMQGEKQAGRVRLYGFVAGDRAYTVRVKVRNAGEKSDVESLLETMEVG